MAAPKKRSELAPVLIVNFIGTLGYTIAIPFLVYLVARFGGDAIVYGIVASTYSAFQFVGAPILGRWSDRFGRRRILLVSQIGTFVSWLVFGLALYLPEESIDFGLATWSLPLVVIVLARALDGLTGGNISVANAYVADISDDSNRSKNFGRMGVAANLGMVLGPALASVLGATAHGEIVPIGAAALIALVGIVFILRMPERRRCPEQHHHRHDVAQSWGQETRDCVHAHKKRSHPDSSLTLLRRPTIAFLIALNFVIMGAFSFFYTSFPINAAIRLDWGIGTMGTFFASLSVMLVIVQGPILSRLSRYIDESRLISAGLLVLAGAFVLMRAESTAVIYASAALFAIGNGIMWPSVVSVVASAAGKELQGAVQGLAGSAGSLASIFGLVLGGIAYDSIGETTFLLSSALTLVAFVMALFLPRFVAKKSSESKPSESKPSESKPS